MNLDLNLFPLLCFCVSLCITLCSVCLHTSVSVFSWVSVCVLSAPTRMFPCVLCPVCPHCSVSVCPWVSLCILYPHVRFCLSFVLSVPTALFQSVPGYFFVFCLSLHVFFRLSLGVLGVPEICLCLSLESVLFCVLAFIWFKHKITFCLVRFAQKHACSVRC